MRKSLVALVLCFVTACSWFSGKGATAVQVAETCAADKLGQPVSIAGVSASLSMAVTQILAAGSDGWQAELETLAKQVGEAALICAVEVAEALFRAPPTTDAGVSGADMAPSVDQAFPGAHDRAAQFLSTHAGK